MASEKKIAYDRRLRSLIDDYPKILVVAADHVGSKQIQNVRRGLRGHSILLMGKNSMMKRSMRIHAENSGNDSILSLLPRVVGNVGLIFTKGDLKEVSDEVGKYKVGAPARVGSVAPIDVIIPPGNTGLDPSQTSFFQVLNIPTRINKGAVEIISPVEILKKGQKVGSSEAALLSKLGIKPFSYGLEIVCVYENGSVFSPNTLNLTGDELAVKFMTSVSNVASLALSPLANDVKEYLKENKHTSPSSKPSREDLDKLEAEIEKVVKEDITLEFLRSFNPLKPSEGGTPPEHLIRELLLKLPVRMLCRFRVVAKYWDSLISSQEFIHDYNRSPKAATGLLVRNDYAEDLTPNPLFTYIPFSIQQPPKPSFTRLNFTKHQPLTEIVDSCNGLFLCSDRTSFSSKGNDATKYYVVNPCDKTISCLPEFRGSSKREPLQLILAFDPPVSTHYKVIALWPEGLNSAVLGFYSSEERAWKKCFEFCPGLYDTGVYCNGAIHWFETKDRHCLYFNLKTETVGKVATPPKPHDYTRFLTQKRYCGQSCNHLHYVCILEPTIQFEVYELDENFSEFFVKFKVDLSGLVAAFPQTITDNGHRPMDLGCYKYYILSLIRGEEDKDSFIILYIPQKLIRLNLLNGSFEVIYEGHVVEDEEFRFHTHEYMEILCPIVS